VLFDYGGVLAEEGFVQGLRALAHAAGVTPEVGHRPGEEAIHGTGYLTGRGTEAAFWERWRGLTGISGDDAELREELLKRFVLRPRMLRLVRTLRRKGILVAILSDQTDWLERLEARDRFFDEFDKVYSSFHLGKSKRDASVFIDVLYDLDLAPAEALFIDDKVGHVERASSQGLHAIVFRDIDHLVDELKSLKLVDEAGGI
jgi:putative hydrolase of the HAD superfamily